jgi:hypothetical protein
MGCVQAADSRAIKQSPAAFAAILAAFLFPLAASGAGEPFRLIGGRLQVEIEVATDHLAGEFGPRFDRTAFVRSVTVDGVELLGPWGLSDEFGLFGDGVLGYETTAQGETFTKIGVGRLLRDTAAGYQFDHPYPVEALFPVEVTANRGALVVTQRSDGVGPWQYEYRKSYELSGPEELTIRYELDNTGATSWSFEHYNHHWFRVAGAPVGPGYAVVTGFELPAAETAFDLRAAALEMAEPLAPGDAAYYAGELAGVPVSGNTFEVQLDGRAFVTYQASAPPTRFALYADERGFCPEVFMRATVAPGATVRWSATYRFARPVR